MHTSSHPVVILVGNAAPELDADLRARYRVLDCPLAATERRTFCEQYGSVATIAVVVHRALFEADLIAALPQLRLVANLGVGYDNVDVAAAHRAGIIVTHTPGVLDDAVAELAVGLVLACLRHIPASDRYVRDGRWTTEGAMPLTGQLSGRTVGILGLGRIGRAVAERLDPFRCTIRYHSRRPVPDAPYAYVGNVLSLAEGADVLVVAAPASPGAAPLVDRHTLRALGPEGVLINIARGAVVDETAMTDLLLSGELGGAGLDVYRDEPHVPQALLDLEQVVLLPHVGSATSETRRAMAELLVQNIEHFVSSGSALTPVPDGQDAAVRATS